MAVTGENNHDDRDDQQDGIELVHAFLKDYFIGQESEARAYCDHFLFRVGALGR